MNKEFLKYLDIFSENTSFTDKGKINFRSWLGVVLSTFLIITVVILALLFGKDVYERKQFSVSLSEEFTPVNKIVLKDIPPFIVISDNRGNNIVIEGYYSFSTFKMNFTEYNLVNYADSADKFFSFSRCKKENFATVSQFISKEIIESFLDIPSYCISSTEEAAIQNPYKTPNSSFLNIAVVKCNKTIENCADDLDSVASEAYVEFYFINSYIDSNNYINPVNYYYDSISTQISTTYLKRIFIMFSNNKYISDNGWILQEKATNSFIALNSFNKEVNSLAVGHESEKLWITLESPSIKKIYTRNYDKIVDLFARIGGLVNALVIIIQILFCHYFRYNYIMTIREFLNPEIEFRKSPEISGENDNNNKENENNISKKDFGKSNIENNDENNNSIKSNQEKHSNKDFSKIIKNNNDLNNNKCLINNINNINNGINNSINSININNNSNIKDNSLNVLNNYFSINSINIALKSDIKEVERVNSKILNNYKNNNINYNESNNAKNNIVEDFNYINSINDINNTNSRFSLSLINQKNPNFLKHSITIKKSLTKDVQSTDISDNSNIKNKLVNNYLGNKNISAKIKDNHDNSNSKDYNKEQLNNIDNSKSDNNMIAYKNVINYASIIKNENISNSDSNNPNININRSQVTDSYYFNNLCDNNHQVKYDYIDFIELNYFKYLYYMITCSKKKKTYNRIREEIDNLFDIYSFSSFLKKQYMLKDSILLMQN